MLEQPIYVATVIILLLAVGEVISILSKAWIPSLLIIFVGYLVLIWTGVLPADLIPNSAFAAVGSLLVAAVITHMGTLIPISQLRSQYKAILIALFGIVLGAGLILLVVSPILGYATAVAGAGPVTGGILAYIITAERLTELGLNHLVVIPALVLGVQSLIGMPLANILLRKYAVKLRDGGQLQPTSASDSIASSADGGTDRVSAAGARTALATHLQARPATTTAKKIQLLPERFQEPTIILMLLLASGSLATLLGSITGVNYGIWALAIGIIGHVLGIFPPKAMQQANAFGLAMATVIVVVLASMSSVTWNDMLQAFWPVLLILGVGGIGIIGGGWIASKIFKWDPLKGIPVALTAMFGFPGDYILCQEISRSVGRTADEQKTIFDELITPMLVGGFTTVTTASIVVASILVQTI
ncbi:hypothetical protein [Cryobacterium sp. TMT1-66-1]|uniref:hypothetical protein n=1 Tax=Cryobacterium sp. TMT1-66-1 TaxID=1259242 RepID=UPI00106C1649|nr:hypothetical protein [Cryobacterium sp. TMT1-66-1]TFD09844.1 hypothetical protein E3T29_02025 [Cryobacterium sp. TMT1-66-1]